MVTVLSERAWRRGPCSAEQEWEGRAAEAQLSIRLQMHMKGQVAVAGLAKITYPKAADLNCPGKA